MPYSIDRKEKCVYKKKSDGTRGAKVGCTKGDLQKYLGALHASEKSKAINEIRQVLKENAEIVETPIQLESNVEFWGVKRSTDPMDDPGKLTFKSDPVSFGNDLRGGVLPQDIHGFYLSEEEALRVAEGLVQATYEAARTLEAKKNTVTEKIQKKINELQRQVDEYLRAAKSDPDNADSHQTRAEEVLTRIREYRAKHGVVEKAKRPLEEKDKKELKEGAELTVGVDKSRTHQPAHFVYNSKTGQKKYFKTKQEAEKYLKDKKKLKEAAPVERDPYGEDPNLDIKSDKDLPGMGMTEDHEVSMAQNSLKDIISSASELLNLLGQDEKDIPAWIQDHITNAQNYINQASTNYHEYGPEHNSGLAVEAGKDYDKDGKIEKPEEEYKGVKDKAIKKATSSKLKEADQNTTPSIADLEKIANDTSKTPKERDQAREKMYALKRAQQKKK